MTRTLTCVRKKVVPSSCEVRYVLKSSDKNQMRQDQIVVGGLVGSFILRTSFEDEAVLPRCFTFVPVAVFTLWSVFVFNILSLAVPAVCLLRPAEFLLNVRD